MRALGRRGRVMAGAAALVLSMALGAAGQTPCGAPGQPPCLHAPAYDSGQQIHLPPAMAYRQKKAQAALRQRKLKDDSAKLFVLAQQLRVAIGKTNENTLSLAVIRKAKKIEQLAKQIQQMMSRGTD